MEALVRHRAAKCDWLRNGYNRTVGWYMGPQIFQISYGNLSTVGSRHLTWSYSHTEDRNIWGATIQHLACTTKCFCHFLFLFFFAVTAPPPRGPEPPHFRGFLITHNHALQSVGLLWTSDQLVAETSTWQHTTLTTDKHPNPGWDLNPRSQQASGRRPTP